MSAGLRRVLNAYVAYYSKARTHLSLDKDAPISRGVEPPTNGNIAPPLPLSSNGLGGPGRPQMPRIGFSVGTPLGTNARPYGHQIPTNGHRVMAPRFWRGCITNTAWSDWRREP